MLQRTKFKYLIIAHCFTITRYGHGRGQLNDIPRQNVAEELKYFTVQVIISVLMTVNVAATWEATLLHAHS